MPRSARDCDRERRRLPSWAKGAIVALQNGYLYFTENDSRIVRYRMTPGQLLPAGRVS
ncbi:MAG: hypothetical protein HYU37_06770 [Acidobacteria bacterium]|nr:hypothetical protein [Acidobacteriota bacterium]